jgi:hypothetical protein
MHLRAPSRLSLWQPESDDASPITILAVPALDSVPWYGL